LNAGFSRRGLATLPREVARLPRLRTVKLIDNPITSLPFGAESFRSVEILTIGEGYFNGSAEFTKNLDLAQFPWLRVLEQRYDINTIDELAYHDSDGFWNNPHLEILNIGWPALKHGIPAGLLRARNLRALATRINAAQLGSALWRLPAFERLEYLAIGHTDLSRARLAQLCDGLPRAFISCDSVEFASPEAEKLEAVEQSLRQRHFSAAISLLDDLASSLNLRRPLMPIQLHAKLMTLLVRVPRAAGSRPPPNPGRGNPEIGRPRAVDPASQCRSVLVSRLSPALAGSPAMPLRPGERPGAARRARRGGRQCRPGSGPERTRPVPAPDQPQLAWQRDRQHPQPSRPDTRLNQIDARPTKKRRPKRRF
jgi:hypothetical protein